MIEPVDMWVTDGGPKALEDLTREELIDALRHTSRQLSAERGRRMAPYIVGGVELGWSPETGAIHPKGK